MKIKKLVLNMSKGVRETYAMKLKKLFLEMRVELEILGPAGTKLADRKLSEWFVRLCKLRGRKPPKWLRRLRRNERQALRPAGPEPMRAAIDRTNFGYATVEPMPGPNEAP